MSTKAKARGATARAVALVILAMTLMASLLAATPQAEAGDDMVVGTDLQADDDCINPRWSVVDSPDGVELTNDTGHRTTVYATTPGPHRIRLDCDGREPAYFRAGGTFAYPFEVDIPKYLRQPCFGPCPYLELDREALIQFLDGGIIDPRPWEEWLEQLVQYEIHPELDQLVEVGYEGFVLDAQVVTIEESGLAAIAVISIVQ